NPAVAPYYLARGWLFARRPDRAWPEVHRALKADPKHQPSLLLAGQMALADQDWESLLKYAKELEAVQPNPTTALLWRAAALTNLGKADEARAIYQDLTGRFPDVGAGYAGMAEALERDRDYTGALKWVARWRGRLPNDLGALRAEVRLLVWSGREGEAARTAEDYLAEHLRRLEDRRVARANRNLPADEQERQQRARSLRDALAARKAAVLLNVADGFQGAHAYDLAEAWARRAVESARGRAPAEHPADPGAS